MKKFLPFILLLLLCAGRALAQVPTLDQKCVATTGTNQTFCTVAGIAANEAIIVHLYFGTGQTLSSLQDCTGSSACSSSTDVLAPSISCVTLLGVKVCEYYICASALSGSVAVTSNFTGSLGTNYVEVSTWKGLLSSGCLDQTGSGTTGSSNVTSLSVPTAGNVNYKGELVIGFVQVGTPPTAGSGFTQIQISGNLQSEYLTSPTAGVGTSATWTFASTTGRGLVSTWKGGIFHDADHAYVNCGNVSSCAWTHTVGTGPNPFLWVVFGINQGIANVTITNVTAGGVSMGIAKSVVITGSENLYAYYLTGSQGLTTGSISIVISLSAAVGATNNWFAGSTSFTGVAQNNPFDAATVATGATTGTTFSTSITTASPGALLVDGVAEDHGNNTLVASAPQTVSWNSGPSFQKSDGVSYQGPIVTPGSTADTWTDSGNAGGWGLLVAALKPASAVVAAGTQNNMMPMVI